MSSVTFHEALIEASKSLSRPVGLNFPTHVFPQLPPYDHEVVEKNYRYTLWKRRAVVKLPNTFLSRTTSSKTPTPSKESTTKQFLGLLYTVLVYPVSFNPMQRCCKLAGLEEQ